MDRRPLVSHVRITQSFKTLLWIVAVLVAAMHAVPAQAQRFSTFGRTTSSGATPTAGLDADFKRASRITLTESATLKDMCVYLDGKGGGSGLQSIQFALYSDVNGAPGKKVVEGAGWTLDDTAAPQWICRPLSSVQVIPAGQYWFAMLTSGPTDVIRAYGNGSAQNLYTNADAYDDGPADTFGAANAAAGTLVAYVTYYPSSQIRSAGRMTIGPRISQGMTPNYKRVSRFVMPEAGKLWAITSYLDGRGSGDPSTAQAYKYVIYKDANGVPGEKLYESGNHFLPGNSKPMWDSESVLFNVNKPTLAAGRYWVGFLTGDPGYTIRYYYDDGGHWYGNDNAFMDGASSPFGGGTVKNDVITAYVSYRPGPPTVDELGRTDIGTSPSRGLDPNVTRWSSFFLYNGQGTVTSLHAHLDGLGSTSGSQDVRMVLYEYHPAPIGPGPYRKIAQSDVVTVPAGMSKRWVDFDVPPAPICDCALAPIYLIGIQSGANSVARIYGDNRYGVSWSSRPDAFADGPDNEFLDTDPTIKFANSVTLSVYATYTVTEPPQ
jgi:hypothetical protein